MAKNDRPQRRPKGEQNGESSGKEVSKRDEPMKSSRDGRTDTSATLRPLTEASPQDWLGSNQDPDVLLAIPNLGIDHIGIEVDNLKAHVELHAKVLDLLELHVGAQASIEKVDIQIDNVRVQAMLKVRLDRVAEIVSRVMDTIDENPEILTNLTEGLGKGVQGALEGGTSGSNGSGEGGGGDKSAGDDGDTVKGETIEGKSRVEHDGSDQDTSAEDKREHEKGTQ